MGARYLRNVDRTLESGSVDLSYSLGLRSNHFFDAGVTIAEDDLREQFDLADDAWVPAGRYRALEGRIGYTMPTRYPLRTNVNASAGRFFDGTRLAVTLSPFWTPTPRLKVTGTYEVNRITFDTRAQTFTAQVGRVQTELMLDTRVTLSSLVQYNSAADDFSMNARLRINPREGTDLYLVYSESLRTDLGSLAPIPPRSRGRALLVKFSRSADSLRVPAGGEPTCGTRTRRPPRGGGGSGSRVHSGMTDPTRTPFELIGGEDAVRRLVDRFYDVMDTAPEAAGIRALHPPTLDLSREKLFLFLTGWMGGPPLYVERYGHPMLRARHLPFPIGEEERALGSGAWTWRSTSRRCPRWSGSSCASAFEGWRTRCGTSGRRARLTNPCPQQPRFALLPRRR